MAVKVSNGYLCGYCGKHYTSPIEADNCKDSHDLVYLPISREDLGRLVSFIYTREEALLTSSLMSLLSKHMRTNLSVDKKKKE